MVRLKGKLSPVASLLVFPNDHKKDEKDPDYYLYLDEVRKDGEAEAKTAAPGDL